jgi:predicted alpha/beta hydrolase family esterase
MKENLFAIHGFNGIVPVIKDYIEPEGKKLGMDVFAPVFPNKMKADFEKWEKILDEYNKKGLINENTTIIAHSLGTLFVPKYLARRNIKIKLYISLAGFLGGDTEIEDIKKVVEKFLPTEEEINKAMELMPIRYSIYSNNDHLFSKEILENYADRFNSNKVFIPNVGHMGRTSGITKLPQIFDIVEKHLN